MGLVKLIDQLLAGALGYVDLGAVSDDQLATVQGDNAEVVPTGPQLLQLLFLADVVYVYLLLNVDNVPQVVLVP